MRFASPVALTAAERSQLTPFIRSKLISVRLSQRALAQTMTHDDKRNGTGTLFTALKVLDGTIISQCQSRHPHVRWLGFLHLIADR